MNAARLRDFVLGLMATVVTDDEVASVLHGATEETVLAGVLGWLDAARVVHPRAGWTALAHDDGASWRMLSFDRPYRARVGLRYLGAAEMLGAGKALVPSLLKECDGRGTDLTVLVLAPSDNPAHRSAVESLFAEAEDISPPLLIMEPGWVAALVVSGTSPLGVSASLAAPGPWQGGGLLGLPTGGHGVAVRRVGRRLQSVRGTVLDVPGSYGERVRQLEADDPHEGLILMCSTYPPPVTFSEAVIRRYFERPGADPLMQQLALRKLGLEREAFRRHVETHKRIDILDRAALVEYFSAPEYYQLPVTAAELRDQVSNMVSLLREDNYTLCLTPEAVDLCFEVRGPDVQLRTDRRNKAPQRIGRIAGLHLCDDAIANSFQREFWLLYGVTEVDFKSKTFLASWLVEEAERCIAQWSA